MTPPIELAWHWTLKAPLHCGSGLSRPAVADRLIALDHAGKPYIPGDAVKGALRMAAEQVLAWLDAPQAHEYRGTAEPVHPLLAVLFGGAGRHHFRAGTLCQQGAMRMRLPATAIAESGVAVEDTLRTVEVLGAEVSFDTGCTVWLDVLNEGGLAEPAETLLVVALACVESIGGKAGIGWGTVMCEFDKRIALPSGRTIAKASDEEAIDNLKQALALNGDRRAAIFSSPGLATNPPRPTRVDWKKIVLEVHEPACLARRPVISNQIETLDVVPATTLRGALREAWLRAGERPEDIAAMLSGFTRWTPAVPAADGDRALAPVPLSWFAAKRESGFGEGSPHGIFDILSGVKAEDIRPIRGGWIEAVANPSARVTLRRQTAMHVARDYRSGSKREGALYARRALVPEPDAEHLRFVAWAKVPEGLDFPATIFIGQRSTAGRGRTTVRSSPADGAPPAVFGSRPGDPEMVFIQLLSKALVRGKEYGHVQRALSPADWVRLAHDAPPVNGKRYLGNPDVVLDAARCLGRADSFTLSGWMRPWKHGRAAVTVMEAGSVWRLACRSKEEATALRHALGGLAESGIGERRHEGFGWFIVNPPWLGHLKGKTVAGNADPPPAAPGIPPEPRSRWPGAERLDDGTVDRLLAGLPANVPADLQAPLEALDRRARVAGASAADVLDHCERMASREPPQRWEELRKGKKARKYLESAVNAGGMDNPDITRLRLQFAIEALITRMRDLS